MRQEALLDQQHGVLVGLKGYGPKMAAASAEADQHASKLTRDFDFHLPDFIPNRPVGRMFAELA
jgi:hypothetical protein